MTVGSTLVRAEDEDATIRQVLGSTSHAAQHPSHLSLRLLRRQRWRNEQYRACDSQKKCRRRIPIRGHGEISVCYRCRCQTYLHICPPIPCAPFSYHPQSQLVHIREQWSDDSGTERALSRGKQDAGRFLPILSWRPR